MFSEQGTAIISAQNHPLFRSLCFLCIFFVSTVADPVFGFYYSVILDTLWVPTT